MPRGKWGRRLHQGLCALAQQERLIYTPVPPMEVFLEITSQCNLRCSTCPQSGDLGRPKGHMGLELFRDLVAQISPWASQVSLFLAGEPLLYPHLAEALQAAKQAGLFTRLHSNGLLLNSRNSDILLSGDLDQLSFSLDGPDAAHYDQIRVGGDFERCLAKVTGFLRQRQDRGLAKPYTIVQSLCLRGEEPQEVERANRELLGDLPYDELKVIPTHSFAGYYKDHLRNRQAIPEAYDTCHMLYNRLTVLSDGRTVACCNDFRAQYVTGDARTTPLLTIWNDEPFRRLRSLLAQGRYDQVELCRDCDALWGGPARRRPIAGAVLRGLARLAQVRKR